MRIDGDLVKKARLAGGLSHRSVSQQIEHWASLGQRIEGVVSAPAIARINRLHSGDIDRALSRATGAAGHKRMLAFLGTKKGPFYGTKPDRPDVLIEYPQAHKPVRGQRAAARAVDGKKRKPSTER